MFSYARGVLLRIPYIKYTADYFFPILTGICLLLSVHYLIKALTWPDVIFVMSVLLIFMVHMLVYPENSDYLLSISGTFLATVLPMYLIGVCFDMDKHIKLLYYASLLNIGLFVMYNLSTSTYVMNSEAAYTSSMSRAYTLLPQLLMVVGQCFKKPNVINISAGIVGGIFLMMCGNRGALLLYVFFIVACVIFLVQKKGWPFYLVTASVVGVVLYFYEWILNLLRVWFLSMGVSTRVIERLAAGDFFESTGRDTITETLLLAIGENPFMGYGMGGDMAIVGSYAHNLAMEMWTSFGVLLGSALLIGILVVFVRGWLGAREEDEKHILLVLLCVGLLKLYLSNSYLLEGMFFLLLGVCVGITRKRSKGKVLQIGGRGRKNYEDL